MVMNELKLWNTIVLIRQHTLISGIFDILGNLGIFRKSLKTGRNAGAAANQQIFSGTG
jgi:hypothetical protein